MGGMLLCYESDREVTRKSTIAWTNGRVKKFIFTSGLIGRMFFCYESERVASQKRKIN